MSSNRERELWKELNKSLFLLAGVLVVFLAAAYVGIGLVTPGRPSDENVLHVLCKLAQDVIANLIPVSLLYISSYLFVRHVQELWSEQETQKLVSRVSSEIGTLLEQGLAALREEGLVIHSAKYGVGSVTVDVAQRLRELISSGRLEIPARHRVLGIDDPAEGVEKQLEVVYSHAVHRQTRTVPEGETLLLP